MHSKQESEVKQNDERNAYRRKSKTEMAADGRNEHDLGPPYRTTERLSGWLHEYSHRSGWLSPEESRIKEGGETVIKKIDETISAMCDEIQREIKEESINREMIPEMVKALAELISARAKIEIF